MWWAELNRGVVSFVPPVGVVDSALQREEVEQGLPSECVGQKEQLLA